MFGGKIRGAYQIYITTKILEITGVEMFPRYRNFLKFAADLKNQWYGWEGFCEFLEEVEKKVSREQLELVGIEIIKGLKEGYVSAGFTSPGAILRDYDPLLKKNTKQMPQLERPKTIQYESGLAVIEVSGSRPKALIEGYFKGIVQVFNKELLLLESEPITRGNFTGYRFKVVWR